MTVFDDEQAALSRTPQNILELSVVQCQNHYASGAGITNGMNHTEQMEETVAAFSWVHSGVTVVADDVAAPDGSVTAEKLTFAGVGDFIEQQNNFGAVSADLTESVFLRSVSGTGTMTLELTNSAATVESTKLQVNLTTEWQRFAVRRLFTGAAGGNRRPRILRDTGDLTECYAWGMNLTLNPTAALQLFDYARQGATQLTIVSDCQAVDLGDGNRCFYSFPTCQDRPNFLVSNQEPNLNQHLRLFQFVNQQGPLPFPGTGMLPYLQELRYAPQKIDQKKSVTRSERIEFKMADDQGPPAWNLDKASQGAPVNTQSGVGSFWRRFLAIYKNYANPDARIRLARGFVATGMTEALYAQRFKGHPTNLKIGRGGMVTLEAADLLKDLKDVKVPAKISDTNLLDENITAGTTTFDVVDAAEFTEPSADGSYFVVISIGDPTAELMNLTSRDTTLNKVTVARGRWGSTAASHSQGDAIIEQIEFGTEDDTPSDSPLPKPPTDIVIELLRMGGIDLVDIDVAGLDFERDTWLPFTLDTSGGSPNTGYLFRRTLTKQTSIQNLLTEIRKVILLDLFVNEAQVVTGRIFSPARPEETLLHLTDADNIVADSIELDDQEDTRITRVLVAWGLIAGETGDKAEDYTQIHFRIDTEAESAGSFGDNRLLSVLTEWIDAADTFTGPRLAQKILARFRTGVRELKLTVERKDDTLKTGDFAFLTTDYIQTPHGVAHDRRQMQVVAKANDREGRQRLTMIDTGLFRMYGFIGHTGDPDYNAASAQNRRHAYIGTSGANLVGTEGSEGYHIW